MTPFGSMRFERYGRVRQLRIDSAEDLMNVLELEETHWVATGAPVGTINADPTFLGLLDSDRNGRVMCFELKEAIEWFFGNFRDPKDAALGSETLQLDAINTDNDQGREIHESATKMLRQLGLGDSREITLSQIRKIKAAVEAMPVSEAGVVLPEAANDEKVKQFIVDIIATVGGTNHPGGQKGVGQAQLDDFLARVEAYLQWYRQGEIPDGQSASEIMPLGDRTPQAFALYTELREKVDQYFAQCEAVAFDQRAAERFAMSESEMQAMDFSQPQTIETFIKESPLTTPRTDRILGFDRQVNPAYAPQLTRLRNEVLAAMLGRPASAMSSEQWQEVKQFFSAHEKWANSRPGQSIERFGPDTLAGYMDNKFRHAVETLIAESTRTAFVLDNIRLTEKLILFQAHLLTLANNFVSFPHLYNPASRALFEMGTLIMDGRRFNFSIKVNNRAEHSKVARSGNMFVLYAEIMPSAGTKYEIALPVTHKGKGNLCVGKRGVFQDVFGGESDGRIVQIIENPISIGEAIVSPFRRFGRMLSGKIESITTSAEKEFDTKAAKVIDSSKQAKPAEKPAAQNSGLLAGGLLMGGGVALAAIGSAIAYATQALQDVPSYKIALGIVIVILAVVLPVSIMGLIKLRKRDMSSILEGSGWAINASMRLTLRQGRFFTQKPRSPKA